MATIRKRGGRWQVQVRLTNAKSKTRSFKTKPEALAWARMIEAEILQRSKTDNSSISNYTFGETIEKYLARVTANLRHACFRISQANLRHGNYTKDKLMVRGIALVVWTILC